VKTILILMDSLNRHYLPPYGGWARTPNLERLAARSLVFDNHWCASLPCMPARRDLMTGRLSFLEAPWGPVEPWDECWPELLRRERGVYSHLITDHYHYFHAGGEGYPTLFDSWEFERGQEGDAWRPLVEPAKPPAGTRGRGVGRRAYWANRAWMDPEDDLSYSTPRCFERAIEFLRENGRADHWILHLEVFDPHEPFDCPKCYRDLYDDRWERPAYTWPAYARLDPKLDDAEAVAHIRKCYAGTLTMADAWLGKLLDRMDAMDLWRDTRVVLTTDHGHLLGEHGYWAKNYMFDYAELARLPLLVAAPGVAPRRVGALTSLVDLMPTLLDGHGGTPPAVPRHGRSLGHLLAAEEPHHDAVLYGYFGKDLNWTDGRHTYARAPLPGSVVHHHTAMPRGFSGFLPRERLAAAECGVFLPHTFGIPHFRLAAESHRFADAPDFSPLYDLRDDPGQERPVRDPAMEARCAASMKELLERFEAPPCQFARLGLRESVGRQTGAM
jgi:arylsulfatase A-like enzyme